jgi:hypothetical protein
LNTYDKWRVIILENKDKPVAKPKTVAKPEPAAKPKTVAKEVHK